MKKILLALLFLALSLPSYAADNIAVTAGTGTTVKMKDVGAGVLESQVLLSDSTGASILGVAGTANSNVVTVQGIAGGTMQPVSIGTALPAGTNVIGHTIIDTGSTTAVTQATASNLNATVVGTGTFGVQAAQSGTWNVTNISGTVSLPTGAATAAKQPALGTAGTASSDVITVQGAASMTPLTVGGLDVNVATTPTIQNASYVSGNCMGGFQAVSLARVSGGSGIINKFSLISTGGGTTTLQVYIFDSNPSGSTCTDKSTFSIATADQSKLLTTFAVLPAVLTGVTMTEAELSNMAAPFKTNGNANVYVGIVSAGTWTPASTTDLIFRLGAIQD